MIVTAELLAFARGYHEGWEGEDRLPYHQHEQSELCKIYYVGRAHGVADYTPDYTPDALPVEESEPAKVEAAIPIRAKTAG